MTQQRKTWITLGVLAVVCVIIFFITGYLRKSEPVSAKVGDCMKQTGSNSLTIVKCTDSGASYVVVGRVENKTEVDASIGACKDFDKVESSYWEGKRGEKGMVLCLAKHTP